MQHIQPIPGLLRQSFTAPQCVEIQQSSEADDSGAWTKTDACEQQETMRRMRGDGTTRIVYVEAGYFLILICSRSVSN